MDWKKRYQIMDTLNETFKGAVFKAKDLQTDRLVVCRVLYNTNAEYYNTLKQLVNSHIPEIYEVISDQKDTIVTEEYIEGETLAALLAKGTVFTAEETVSVFTQLCEGLSAIHLCGIIHRDIKPENIMISGSRVVLIDFDAARKYNIASGKDTVYMGTEGYAAPEQYGFSQTDSRSDIYALGVVMKELTKNDSHPLAPIIWRCTAFDPANRYSSAREIISDIKRHNLLNKMPAPAKAVKASKKTGLAVKIPFGILFGLMAVVMLGRMPHEITALDYILSKLVYAQIIIFPAALVYNFFHLWQRLPLLRSPKIGFKIMGIVLYILAFVLSMILFSQLAQFFYSDEALRILSSSQ